jgi:hypothetical protein
MPSAPVQVRRYRHWENGNQRRHSSTIPASGQLSRACEIYNVQPQTEYVLYFAHSAHIGKSLRFSFHQEGPVCGDRPLVTLTRASCDKSTEVRKVVDLDDFGEVALFRGAFGTVSFEFNWSVRPVDSIYKLVIEGLVGRTDFRHALAFRLTP